MARRADRFDDLLDLLLDAPGFVAAAMKRRFAARGDDPDPDRVAHSVVSQNARPIRSPGVEEPWIAADVPANGEHDAFSGARPRMTSAAPLTSLVPGAPDTDGDRRRSTVAGHSRTRCVVAVGRQLASSRPRRLRGHPQLLAAIGVHDEDVEALPARLLWKTIFPSTGGASARAVSCGAAMAASTGQRGACPKKTAICMGRRWQPPLTHPSTTIPCRSSLSC